jgi:RimJ/RimL family protein N-acetyltransferase
MIELRPFTIADFDKLIDWSPSPEFLLQWTGSGFSFPLTRDQLAQHLESASGPESTSLLYTAWRVQDDEPVGHGEILKIDRENLSGWIARVLVGPPGLRGEGLGGSIVRGLVKIGFGELELNRLDLNVFEFNRSAIRCYERVGFQHERTLPDARKQGEAGWNVRVMTLSLHDWGHKDI